MAKFSSPVKGRCVGSKFTPPVTAYTRFTTMGKKVKMLITTRLGPTNNQPMREAPSHFWPSRKTGSNRLNKKPRKAEKTDIPTPICTHDAASELPYASDSAELALPGRRCRPLQGGGAHAVRATGVRLFF